MTINELPALRLQNQKIIHSNLKTPHDAVAWLGAVQSQDLPASLHAVGLRIPGSTEQEIEAAITDRTIVRTWPMRSTIHLLPAEDALWITRLLGPRQNKKGASIYRNLSLTDTLLEQAGEVLRKCLANSPKDRAEIYAALEKAGIPTGEGRGLHIIKYWGQEGLLCIAPRIRKQHTFALLETWVRHNTIASSDEGFSILAGRYFKSHGPATLKDFMWWTGATKAEASKGLEAVKHLFDTQTINGQEYFFSPVKTMPTLDSNQAILLPAFDEYTVAYADRSAVIDTKDMKKVYYGINPNIVIGGQVLGTWKRIFKAKAAHITLLPFSHFSSVQLDEISKAAQRYETFIEKEVVVKTN